MDNIGVRFVGLLDILTAQQIKEIAGTNEPIVAYQNLGKLNLEQKAELVKRFENPEYLNERIRKYYDYCNVLDQQAINSTNEAELEIIVKNKWLAIKNIERMETYLKKNLP